MRLEAWSKSRFDHETRDETGFCVPFRTVPEVLKATLVTPLKSILGSFYTQEA